MPKRFRTFISNNFLDTYIFSVSKNGLTKAGILIFRPDPKNIARSCSRQVWQCMTQYRVGQKIVRLVGSTDRFRHSISAAFTSQNETLRLTLGAPNAVSFAEGYRQYGTIQTCCDGESFRGRCSRELVLSEPVKNVANSEKSRSASKSNQLEAGPLRAECQTFPRKVIEMLR